MPSLCAMRISRRHCVRCPTGGRRGAAIAARRLPRRPGAGRRVGPRRAPVAAEVLVHRGAVPGSSGPRVVVRRGARSGRVRPGDTQVLRGTPSGFPGLLRGMRQAPPSGAVRGPVEPVGGRLAGGAGRRVRGGPAAGVPVAGCVAALGLRAERPVVRFPVRLGGAVAASWTSATCWRPTRRQKPMSRSPPGLATSAARSPG